MKVAVDRPGKLSRSKQSRSNVPPKYAFARRFFARLATEIFLTSLQTDFFNNLLAFAYLIKSLFLRIEQVVKSKPQASRVTKEIEREERGKEDPQDELLHESHLGEIIQDNISGEGNNDRSTIVDVHCPYKKALLALKLQLAIGALGVHLEYAEKQSSRRAPGTL